MAAPTETKAEEGPETTTETESPVSDSPAPVAAATTDSSSHRSPSIHFLGKNGWAKRLAGMEESSASPATPSSPNAVVTVQGGEMHPMYGRPRFTEKEMEALIMGGAETAPSVVAPSSGAQFAV